MRCNDFDTHIDEMLSGILHPDASQHMRQCERCTSHYRARATVQNGLRKLAASAAGPSRATDRAVMASYRKLQQRRAAAEPAPTARLFTFPSRGLPPVWTSSTWWAGALAAAVVFAVLGSAVHLWTGAPTVNAPTVANAPIVPAVGQRISGVEPRAASASRHVSPRPASPRVAEAQLASAAPQPAAAEQPVLAAKSTAPRPVAAFAEGASYDSAPVTQLSASAQPVMHLASSATASNNMAQTASSTWPGYSNLMYCDPVVCSGPMQVVHIKVPVGQVKPNLGQTVGNAFVNAEVVIGPDGVARAIRVAN